MNDNRQFSRFQYQVNKMKYMVQSLTNIIQTLTLLENGTTTTANSLSDGAIAGIVIGTIMGFSEIT